MKTPLETVAELVKQLEVANDKVRDAEAEARAASSAACSRRNERNAIAKKIEAAGFGVPEEYRK